MLLELKVSNFAIIDNVHIQFKQGFNILSGETGAGKTILLKSLSLLMGTKATSDILRKEDDTATVEGSFDISSRPDLLEKLSSMGIDCDDGQLIVRRLIMSQGKSRVYINGSLSPLNILQDLVTPLIEVAGSSAPLIELTGQHENKNLLSKAYHLNVLDRFSGTHLKRKEFGDLFKKSLDLKNEISEIELSERNRAQRLDFLCYQRDEIKVFGLREGEEAELEQDYLRLRNSSQLQVWAQQAEETLYSDDESALVRIHRVIQKSVELSQFDLKLVEKTESLKQAKTLIEDTVYNVRAYIEGLDAEPDRLDAIEKRRSDLKTLLKKYGPTVEDVLRTFENVEREIRTLENSNERLKDIKTELAQIDDKMKSLATDLHKRREKGAKLLATEVNSELKDLNMKGSNFEIQIEKLPEFLSTGLTDVEFMIRSGSKENPRSIGKSASGGELSRILLALKSVVGQSDLPRTCLFDEVDAGVSGPTAEKVGKKLKAIAKGQQVICVTHLPQVAAHGDVHFLIQKTPSSRGFQTIVVSLKKDDRVKEIARLISGEKITSTSLAHAKQLLEH